MIKPNGEIVNDKIICNRIECQHNVLTTSNEKVCEKTIIYLYYCHNTMVFKCNSFIKTK
jgi:hypothetical protein